jgi:hypothetical protein
MRNIPRAPTAAEELRTNSAAVRVSFTWLGVRRSLSTGQKAQVAETFGAQEKDLSASKRILDVSDPLFRDVTAVKNRIIGYWRAMTLAHPEPGIRLLRREKVEDFSATLDDYRRQLHKAVDKLESQYSRLKDAARIRLGTLFNESDYPPHLSGMFDVSYEILSLEPPPYLLELSPALYEEQQRRVTARFEEAVRLAEEAFTSELAKLVTHLVERLTNEDAGGEKKVFRDSAIANLTEFFDRFRSLNVGSNAQLDQLVATAQQAIRGVRPQDLRDRDALRQEVNAKMSSVLASLDGMLIDAPRRRLLRPATSQVA